MTSAVEAALAALDAGISVVPVRVDGSKAPAVSTWKQYQTERLAPESVPPLFAGCGIAILGGAISGNLEILDFESEDAFAEFIRRAQESSLGDVIERIATGYMVQTGGGGFHLAYRCPARPVAKSQKLAKNAARELLVETRGEAAYVIAPGSPAATHETGREYVFERGGFESIADVTPEEHDDLLDLARSLDETERPVEESPKVRFSRGGRLYDGESPGDAFNARATWSDVLLPHGWKRLFTDAKGITYWRRPGKTRGISATTGVHGGEYFYVFTTSTAFDANRGYDRFGAYSILEHDRDHHAAARDLLTRGYGGTPSFPVAEVVDLALITDQRKPKPKKGIPNHLLQVDGLVGDLQRYIVQASRYPQPELALAAALCAVATLVGRKVRTASNLRTNLYVLGVAPQGAGKEFGRSVVKDLFRRIDAFGHVAHDKLASDAAIWSALEDEPASLFMLDEMGRLFTRLNAKHAPAHLEAQVDAYLTLYSQANQVVVTKSYADASKRGEIVEPCLSIYGTTVPSNFYAALSGADVSSGFLSRFLVFEATSYPDPVEPTAHELPEKIVEGFRRWHERPIHGGNLETAVRGSRPEPYTVPASSDAESVFRELEIRMRARARRAVEKDDEPGVEVRVGENARKLALILACGADPVAPSIDASTARWACELAEHLADAFTTQLERRAGESDRERNLKALAAFIEGKRSVTASEITRRFQSWDRRTRDELVADLVDSGRVTISEPESNGKRGRPKKVVTWTEAPEVNRKAEEKAAAS